MAVPQRERPLAESLLHERRKKDTCRADAPQRFCGNEGGIVSLNVGGTTKYASHALVP